MMTNFGPMFETLIPVVCLVVGVFIGAWLNHRGRSGLSPLPRIIPERKEKNGDTRVKFPQVKP